MSYILRGLTCPVLQCEVSPDMEIAAARLLRKPFLAKLEKKKNVRTSRVLPGASVLAVLLSSVRKFRILASQAGGHMHLPSREAARLALLIGCVLALVALYPLSFLHAQEKPVEKSAADQQPTAAPTPPEQPAQQRLGTELDGPVIVNTDLITLTVTVTDTYGRYVSGLGKNAFQYSMRSSRRKSLFSAMTIRPFPLA